MKVLLNPAGFSLTLNEFLIKYVCAEDLFFYPEKSTWTQNIGKPDINNKMFFDKGTDFLLECTRLIHTA